MKNKKTILMADDDQSARKLYSEIFDMAFPDYHLEVFEDGTSLKGRLEKSIENVALVSTDNQMPGIPGNELIKEYAKKVPMILVYGGAQHIGETAVENGAIGYLLKPTKAQHFITAIKMGLDYFK